MSMVEFGAFSVRASGQWATTGLSLSAPLMTVFVKWMAEQSRVKKVKRAELSPQPWGMPVFRTSVDDIQ